MEQSIGENAWLGIIASLESLLPYYERTNLVNSMLLLPLWRRELSHEVSPEDGVLEIGSGSGGLARLLGAREVVCLDPSSVMLKYARSRLDGDRYSFASALAESLPFAQASFDRVLCSFSFRDFMDKRQVFKEVHRILRPGGSVHILELLRPEANWRRFFMDAWIEKAVPVIAHLLVPRHARSSWERNPYVDFAMTYRSTSPIKEYVWMAEKAGFEDVNLRFLGMKSIFLLQGVKPRTML